MESNTNLELLSLEFHVFLVISGQCPQNIEAQFQETNNNRIKQIKRALFLESKQKNLYVIIHHIEHKLFL